MVDIVLEIIRVLIVAFIFYPLYSSGRNKDIRQQQGWLYIVVGFGLILFGTAVDVTDNFPSLNKYIIIGDTVYQAFLEKVIGFLGGFFLLAIGFWKWIPVVITLRKTEKSLKEAHDFLELKVNERTAQLEVEIQERKQTEQALENSNAIHHAMIENIGDVIGIMGVDGIMKYKSANIEKFFGWKPEDLVGTDGWNTVYPEDIDRIQKAFYSLLQKDNSSTIVEYRYKCKDGSYKWIELTAVNNTNNPLINGVLLNYHDITERIQAEEALQESEQTFRALFEKGPIGVAYHKMIYDESGNPINYLFLAANKSYQKLTGVNPNGKLVTEAFPGIENDPFNWIGTFGEVAKMGKEIRFQQYLQQNDRWYDCVGYQYKPDHFVAAFLEITEQKRTVIKLNENQIQLQIAKEEAEESDRLKSAFLANMSHEIRTPMNGILGFADLLKEPGLSGETQQEYIRIIEKGGARMLNIINDIVSISKIEAGMMGVNIQESNINEQIEYIYTFFKPEVEGKGMQLSFSNSLPSREVTLKTDREKVYAILANLVKNAIKYSEKGSIEFGYVKKAGFLEFYVKDTGIGIPKDRQEAIFERFLQADIADKMARQGAGLGLSISKAYVEMLGGNIWVESEEGNLPAGKAGGSVFYFTLPYPLETIKENSTKKEISTPVEALPINKLKILIVEDDEPSEMFLSALVKEHSKALLEARTGIEAVDICRNNPDIDLVLMDIQMPGLNGYEATRQIRQFNKDVIIIAQTAFGLSGDKEKAIEADVTIIFQNRLTKTNYVH